MHAWEIQSTLKWIEENLPEHPEIEKLAEIAHLSPFYYQRLFSRLVGKPVMAYVRLRRLANAANDAGSFLNGNMVQDSDRIIRYPSELFSRRTI